MKKKTMSDLISREAAIEAFYSIKCNVQMMDDSSTADKIMNGLRLAENAIELLPSAQHYENELKHLREQHIADQKRIKDLQDMLDQGIKEISMASEMLLTEIAIKYGKPVVEDGEVIGTRIEIPQAKVRDGYRLFSELREKYVGLEHEWMFRIGVVFPEDE